MLGNVMFPRRILPCLIVMSLFNAATGLRSAAAQSAAPTPAPKSAFAVEENPLPAEDLAKELGYSFYGCTYHFTEPVYVRMTVTGVDPARNDDTHPVEIVLFEPSTKVLIKILRKEDPAEKIGQNPTEVTLNYKINLRGRGADRERAARLQAVRAMFSNVLTDQSDAPRNAFAMYGTTQHLKGGGGLDYSHMKVGTGHPGVLLPNDELIKKLADDMTTPGGEERVASEKAKWQAIAEAELLRKPVEVYRDVAEMVVLEGEHKGEVKQHAELKVVLEFSRQPLSSKDVDEEAKKSADRRGDTGHGSEPLPKASPAK